MRKGILTFATVLVSMGALSWAFGPIQGVLGAPGFNNADLKGEYSLKLVVYPSTTAFPQTADLVLFSADGAGNYTKISVFDSSVTDRGTYVVRPNGTGSFTSTQFTGNTTVFVLNNRGAGADGLAGFAGGTAAVTLTKQ